jgi:gamma-glutamylcysteine synthetase
VQAWAEDVLGIALTGLARHALRDASGQDERIYLKPLMELIAVGQTSAERLLAAAREGGDAMRARVIERARV